METKQEHQNIRWGIIITYIRLAVYIVVGLLYPPFLLEKVGKDINGLFLFATSTVGYTLLISLGMENSYVKYATVHEKDEGEQGLKKINGFYLIVFGVMSLVMLLVGIALAFLYGTGTLPYEGATPAMNNTLFWLILILSVTSSLDFFLSLFTWYIYYKSHFIFEQILYLSLHIATILGSFLFLYFGHDIIAVALVTGCVTVLFDAVGAIYAIGKLKMSFDLMDKPSFIALLKEVLKFSLYIFFMMIVSFINQNIGKTVLGHVIGMASVTIFGYGLQFYNYEAQIASAISSQFSPRVNKLVVEQKYDEINNLFTKVSRLQMAVLFLIVGGFAACGQDFINAWLQKTDLSSKDLTNIFYLSLGFLLLWIIPLSQQIGLEIQRAENKHKYLAIVNLTCAVVSIGITVLCVFLLPNDAKVYGPLIGMGCSTIVGMIIMGNLFYQRKLKLPIKSYFLGFAIYGLVAAASWAIVYLIFTYGIRLPTQWNLWYSVVIKGVCFSAIYVFFLLPCLKGFHLDEN